MLEGYFRKKQQSLWVTGGTVLLLIIAYGLRSHRLAYDSIWWDEGFSVYMSRLPLREMLFATAADAHPPLSYAMLHGWMALVGEEEFSLRVLSVFFGVLTVAVGFQVGREFGGHPVAFASALFIAFSRLPVWWSQEIRMYAPATFFATLAIWAVIRIFMNRQGFWLNVSVLALATASGLLLLYLFAGAVIAFNLAFVFAFFTNQKRWQLFKGWMVSQAAALAIFLPWVFFAYNRLPTWESPQAPVELLQVIKLYLSVIFLGVSVDIERYLPILLIGLVILIGAGATAWLTTSKKSRTGWVLLVICTLLPPILVYLLAIPRGQFNYPTPSPRYFLLLSCPVYVLLGWGVVQINKALRWSGVFIGACLVAVSGWSLLQYYNGLRLTDDYITLASTLEANRMDGDVVLLNNDTDWPIFAYHYNQPFERHISKTQTVRDWKYAEGLVIEYTEGGGIWLVQTPYGEVTDPQNEIAQYLEDRSWNTQTYDFPEGKLIFYAMDGERGRPSLVEEAHRYPTDLVPVEVPISPHATLEGYTQPLHEVQAGSILVVGLAWHVSQGDDAYWPVALSINDAAGKGIASTLIDLGGRSGIHYEPVEVFIPPDTLSGRVQLSFAAGNTWQQLDTLIVKERKRPTTVEGSVPASAKMVEGSLGDIRLQAVSLPDEQIWEAGTAIPITFYWEANQPLAERYKVFVHIVGDEYNPATNNAIWGQQDQEPNGGETPTTGWYPGDLVQDEYLVPISEDAPPGMYKIQVGMYQPLGGGRLPTFDAKGDPIGDTITLMEIEVR